MVKITTTTTFLLLIPQINSFRIKVQHFFPLLSMIGLHFVLCTSSNFCFLVEILYQTFSVAFLFYEVISPKFTSIKFPWYLFFIVSQNGTVMWLLDIQVTVAKSSSCSLLPEEKTPYILLVLENKIRLSWLEQLDQSFVQSELTWN